MPAHLKTVTGNIVDLPAKRIYPGTLIISGGYIQDIIGAKKSPCSNYLIPGFVDAHIHIESSMLVPSEFARAAALHGTVAAISDPHEIANVLGISGIRYMIENGNSVPFKFYFSAPSCVPATLFETAGASLGTAEVEELLRLDTIKYLGEMMNFPGVLCSDPEVMAKISAARKHGKPVDGHSPGLRGDALKRYAQAGISTNHECLSYEEALENISVGLKVLIRKGSAADIFEECLPLLAEHSDMCMFCSDDKHPDDLARGYINDMVRDAIRSGLDPMKVLQVASVNPVRHYGLDTGLLQKGDSADFLVIDNLQDMNILETYIQGTLTAQKGTTCLPRAETGIVNNFSTSCKKIKDFRFPYRQGKLNVIKAIERQVFTERLAVEPYHKNGYIISDPKRDILKIAVVNRYCEAEVAMAFVQNFGLQKGGIASSVSHDSHNIVAVGVSDRDICRAVNLVIEHRGGISAVADDTELVLPLPVAGIMSNDDYVNVTRQYIALDKMAKSLGSRLHAPFMTLSFMALLVIPKLKLSDKGLFDGEKFEYIAVSH